MLRDLAPGQQYAIQFRSNNGAGGTSDWSQVQRFTTTSDTLHPDNVDPNGLTWYNTGTSFIAQWYPVTTNTDGSNLHDLKDYHVAITNGQTTVNFYTTNTSYEFTRQQCIQQFGSWQTALTVTVTARDLTWNESPTPATKAVNPLNPPTPSAPGISTYLGLLMASWNSQTADGRDMQDACSNFSYCEVHVFTLPNQPIPANNSSLVGRVFADGSASKFVIPNLLSGQSYYVKLVAVNMLGKKSGPSAETMGKPVDITGLNITDGRIAAEQINWTSTNIPGGNAYYQTSQPTLAGAIGGAFGSQDVWYDTDDGYTPYHWNGTTWVAATDVGFIAGQKIIAGTITADKVGTNFLIAAAAKIGHAWITSADITTITASQITTGAIQATASIYAGNPLTNHAEMNSNGFYVYTEGPTYDGTTDKTLVQAVKMGTGDGDTFSIPDPNNQSNTLASISSTGVGSFQDIYCQQSPTIAGKDLLGTPAASYITSTGSSTSTKQTPDTQWFPNDPGAVNSGILPNFSFGQVASGTINITGLEPSGSAGIRSEYGIAQFRMPVVKGRTYLVRVQLPGIYAQSSSAGSGEIRVRLYQQKDNRTLAQQKSSSSASAATRATTNSSSFAFKFINYQPLGGWQDEWVDGHFNASFTGYANIAMSLEYAWPSASDAVLKVANGGTCNFVAFDMGPTVSTTAGVQDSMGGTFYAYTPPAPPPPPTTQNYYWEGHRDWTRSYKGTNAWMTNDNGNAYQGQDPSGYNGNQHSFFGWNTDIASMLSGASNITIHVNIYFAHWYNNSGGTAIVGTHGTWADPGTAASPGYFGNRFQVAGVPKPGSFEIDISSVAGEFQSGGTRGITLGAGPSTSYTYYGYSNDAMLKIWYTK